nr:unnamed protein product [Digitaria exilis]
MFVTSVVQLWTEWGLRISVVTSLAAYVVLSLMSGARRRSASGGYSILRWAVVLILWVAYQLAEVAATSVLGSLSFSCSDASPEEKQIVAFWAPFLLLHLGGPDNITAYTLEDNMLSLRRPIMMAVHVLWVINAIWNYIYRSRTWVLFLASAIMFVAGVARYAERVCALRRANLDNMQQDYSSKKTQPVGSSCSTSAADRAVDLMISRSLGRELDDDEALLLAQDLFHIWRRALVDSSVDPRSPSQLNSQKLLSLEWSSLCKVAEMELSLMYDVLYTKASLAHTWTYTCYLIIRFMSPFATGAAIWLFSLYRNKQGRGLSRSFVLITYLLLGATIFTDVVWLLRALGSTWTYGVFLKVTAWRWPWAWCHHQLVCARRWRRLRRAVVCLDPMRLVFGIDVVRHRRWSGTIGRYNLLHECSTVHLRRPWCRWLATKTGLEETRYVSKLPEGVKELLFERLRLILPTADKSVLRQDGGDGDTYTMDNITTCWGQETLRRRGDELFEWSARPIFGREFEQDVLVWHMATCIFLSLAKVRKVKTTSASPHVAAIEALSEYLMFLVVERRQMLPGLVLHNLLEETRDALKNIWNDEGSGKGRRRNKRVELATLVRRMRNENREWALDNDGRRLILDAAEISAALTSSSRSEERVLQMLEFIFQVWVDKLVYAGVRCSRESHAKQLSAGTAT